MAVKTRARSLLQSAALESGPSGGANDALIIVPSITPHAVAFSPPPTVRTRLLPDCEISTEAFASDEADLLQRSAERRLASDSILQTPSTEIGAVNVRPLLRIPASPSRGSPTRRMYATTKFRFVCEIALLPCHQTSAARHVAEAQTTLATAKTGGGRRPRSSHLIAYATDAFRSARPSKPLPSSWSKPQVRPRRIRLPEEVSGRRAGSCDR